MFAGWARNDLQDYRSHYPDRRDDPTLNDNIRFYRNEIPLRPENKTIQEIHEKWYGDWEWLEYCHSYIQWLFPIQESGLNWQAQILQKHEIDVMKNDPEVLENVLTSFELMLDFYGFEIETDVPASSGKKTAAAAATSLPKSFQKSEDASVVTESNTIASRNNKSLDLTTAFPLTNALNPLSNAKIVRHSKGYQKQFHNLNTSGHNYLRITRINKFLGEMGLEHLKLAWLSAFEREMYNDKLLYNCVDSFARYWLGTIYDDDIRAGFEERAEAGKEAAEKLKKEAWAARFGNPSSSSEEKTEDTKAAPEASHDDNADNAEEGLRVITDFGGSREDSAADKSENANNNNEGPVDHVFRVNTSDMESVSTDNGGNRQNSQDDDDQQN